MDYRALLYDPIYLIHGVTVNLTLADARVFSDFVALDKTAGINVGDSVEVPTIAPAACFRIPELRANQIEVRDLPGAILSINGFTWKVVNYKLRPSPNGENEGEVLLILSGKAATVHRLAALLVDQALFAANMEPIFGGLFRDQSQFTAALSADPQLTFFAGSFVDDTNCVMELSRPIRLIGSFTDADGFSAILTRIIALRATFVDTNGFTGALDISGSLEAVNFVDESQFVAALEVTPPLQAVNFVDQSQFAGVLTITTDDGDATVDITGVAAVDETLTAVFNDDDPDGPATGITYQWKRDGVDITGETASTYDVVEADEGTEITVVVDYTDGEGFAESVTSDPVLIDAPDALTADYLSFTQQTTDAAVYTFATVGLGAADASRRIVVAVHSEDTTNFNVNTVTVGGISAILLGGITSFTSTRHLTLWMADVPAGTTGDIVVSCSATSNDCGIGVWRLAGSNPWPYTWLSSKHSNANVVSQALQTKDVGAIIAAATNTDGFLSTWTNLTEKYDNVAGTSGQSGASVDTNGTNVTVGYSNAGEGGGLTSLAAVAFGFGGNLLAVPVHIATVSPSAATHSYTSSRFGGPRSDRHIVVAVHSHTDNRTISGVTIGGVAATPIVTHGSGALFPGGLFIAKVPSGDTGTVAVTFNSSTETSLIHAWAIYGADEVEVVDSFVGNNADPLTDTLTSDPDGVVLSAFFGSSFVSWTSPSLPFYQDYILTTSPTLSRSSGSGRTLGTSVTVSADQTSANAANWMLAVTLRPAA